MALEHFNKLREGKRKRILFAIVDCLKESNYDKLSINDIVKEAEISRGSFYNYFVDKNDAVYTLIATQFVNLEKVFKNAILKCNGNLFDGTIETYNLINNVLKEKSYFEVVKNIEPFMGIINRIIYSQNYEARLDTLLDWLIENTIEGREKLVNRKIMANVLELLVSLFLNNAMRVIFANERNQKYDDFDLKLNIIRKGVKCIDE